MKVKIKKVPQANNGLTVENNAVNPISPYTANLGGAYHKDGGVDISYMGNQVEAEKNEPLSINNNGDLVVWGNMRIPNTKTKFKTAIKQIGKEEEKANKQSLKAQDLVASNDPYNKYEALSFNSGLVKQDAANQKLEAANKQKEVLGQIQEVMLQEKNQKKAQRGATISPQDEYNNWLYNSPDVYGNPVYIPEGVRPNTQGTLAQRNNNPGNLKYVGQKGATKGDKGFARFNSYEEGMQAMINDLRAKQTGKSRTGLKPNSTLQDLIGVYAPASDNNNPTSYANTVAQSLGVTPNTPIKDLDTANLAKAMAVVEDRAYAAQMGNNPIPQQQSEVFIPRPNTQPTYTNTLESDITSGIPTPNNYITPTNSRRYIPGYEDQLNNTQASILNDQLINAQVNRTVLPTVQEERQIPSLADRNKLNFLDFLPEIGAIVDRPDYVQGQQYNPTLLQPYNVSFQDRINQNQSTFNALSRNFSNNPEALSILAGQNYAANNQVLADEFRVNQGNFNQVMNQNTQTLNDAQLRNIGLRDQQYERQALAQANTEANRQAALASISNKYAQNRAENNNLRLVENMFQYRPNENLQLQNYNTTNFTQNSLPTNTPSVPQNTAAQTQYYKAQKAQADAEAARIRAEQASKRNSLGFLNRIFK